MNKDDVLAWIKKRGSQRGVEGMARYGIRARRAFGVSMGMMKPLVKQLGKDHALAAALWKSGWFEARMVAALIDEPAKVTRAQMNAWAADFENWADCDSACFHLFDKTPFAWAKTRQWSASPHEFVKRAAFALMASLALHDKAAPDARFRAMLPIIEKAARDERNFVKKGVSWALRGIGNRSPALNAAALAVAARLTKSEPASCRWVGKDAQRDLTSAATRARLARRDRQGVV
jgi:3-methyladenine DNA glycosylase AlkD